MPNPTIETEGFSRGGTSETTLDQFNQQLRQSPLYAIWMARNGIRTDKGIKLSKSQQKDFASFLAANGVGLPKDFHIDEAGNVNQTSRTGRNLKIAAIAGGVALGGLGLAGIGPLGFLGGSAGAAASGAGLPAETFVGPVAGGSAAGAGTAATTAAGAVAATKGPSVWGKIANTAVEAGIPAVGTVIGSKVAADASTKAAEMQAKAAEEALAWQKEQYAQRQAQLAPTIGVGNSARVKLGELMGFATPTGGYTPQTSIGPGGVATNPTPAAPAAPPTAVPRDPAGGMIPMRAPTGQVSLVAPENVAHYEQAGAVRVV